MRIVELFAGTGNFAKGFSAFGNVVYANDFDRFVEKTYNANHELPMSLGDVWDEVSNIPQHDLLLAGFPCQPFSVAGNQRGMLDVVKGNLFFAIVEALRLYMPRYFVLENVRGIITTNKGKDFETILNTLMAIGYQTRTFIASPHTHANIPQNRERVFFVGFRKLADYTRYIGKEINTIELTASFRDFLDNTVDEKYYYREDSIIYHRLAEVVVRRDRTYVARRTNEIREIKSGLIPTLKANMGQSGNAVPIIRDGCGIRKLTPRECARFQGMSDDYVFPVSDTQAYKQVGNAVNVRVVEAIARSMFA